MEEGRRQVSNRRVPDEWLRCVFLSRSDITILGIRHAGNPSMPAAFDGIGLSRAETTGSPSALFRIRNFWVVEEFPAPSSPPLTSLPLTPLGFWLGLGRVKG